MTSYVVRRTADGSQTLVADAIPQPDGDTVVFGILAAAICGTDRQILRGIRPDAAEVLGHEGLAEVLAVGPDVRDHALGERVVFNPVNPDDQDEILGHSTEGIFRQRFALSEAEVRRRQLVVHVPAGVDLPPEHAVLAEPLGTVIYSHELLRRVREPKSILIVGAGPIGALHAMYAERHASTSRVEIACRSPRRQRWLRDRLDFPAAHIHSSIATAAGSVDAAILCTPRDATADALRAVLPHLVRGGCAVLVGGIADRSIEEIPGVDLIAVRRRDTCGRGAEAPLLARTAAGQELHVLGHRGTAARHLEIALECVADDPGMAAVFSHRVSLRALPQALTTIEAAGTLAGTEYVKAWVDCASATEDMEPLE